MRPVLVLLALSATVPALAAPSREIVIQRVAGKNVHPQAQAIAAAWAERSVTVVLHDTRPAGDPAIVGAQQAKGQLLYEWRSKQPVVDGTRAMIEQTLKSWGVAVVANSPVEFEISLQKLRVDEVPETFGSSYRAEVGLKGGVFDPEGRASTTPGRVFDGFGKSSGPDRRAKLCNEALTAAVEDALAKMLSPVQVGTPKPALTTDAGDPNAVPPKEMLKELMRLKDAGVGEPVLLGYVRQRRLAAPLSTDDILKWKESGLPESVIHAAQEIK